MACTRSRRLSGLWGHRVGRLAYLVDGEGPVVHDSQPGVDGTLGSLVSGRLHVVRREACTQSIEWEY